MKRLPRRTPPQPRLISQSTGFREWRPQDSFRFPRPPLRPRPRRGLPPQPAYFLLPASPLAPPPPFSDPIPSSHQPSGPAPSHAPPLRPRAPTSSSPTSDPAPSSPSAPPLNPPSPAPFHSIVGLSAPHPLRRPAGGGVRAWIHAASPGQRQVQRGAGPAGGRTRGRGRAAATSRWVALGG